MLKYKVVIYVYIKHPSRAVALDHIVHELIAL